MTCPFCDDILTGLPIKIGIGFGYDDVNVSNGFSRDQYVSDPKWVYTVIICRQQLWNLTILVESDQGKNSLFEAGPLRWGA